MNKIRSKKAGGALLTELEATGKMLVILPFWLFGETPYKNADPLFPTVGFNSTARALGDFSIIQYTASMWGPVIYDRSTHVVTGSSGFSGPGTGADEVLFHEMIHGSRQLRGISDTRPVNRGYTNKEEYIAIVLTNIYLAEEKKSDFRADHEGLTRLDHSEAFLKNSQNVDLSPKQLLKQFLGEQRTFFNDLSEIPEQIAWWNPVRDYAKELGLVH